MLINAQPIKFWLNIVGGFIALYFLWEQDIIKSILTVGQDPGGTGQEAGRTENVIFSTKNFKYLQPAWIN